MLLNCLYKLSEDVYLGHCASGWRGFGALERYLLSFGYNEKSFNYVSHIDKLPTSIGHRNRMGNGVWCHHAVFTVLKSFNKTTLHNWWSWVPWALVLKQPVKIPGQSFAKLSCINKPPMSACLWKNSWNHWVGADLWNTRGSDQSLLFHSGALCRVGHSRPQHQVQLVILVGQEGPFGGKIIKIDVLRKSNC